ncbi:MAG TPA: hypothetical protein DC054_03125 [Blastocatellia bacterium]|nr:hypothetical protein [Blastocatellia bacterium]
MVFSFGCLRRKDESRLRLLRSGEIGLASGLTESVPPAVAGGLILNVESYLKASITVKTFVSE